MDAPIPNAYSEELAPTRNKKSKHEHLEGMSGMFRGGMDNLAGAINRLSPLQPISENEIWNMLEELDLESGVNTKAYTFLCRNASEGDTAVALYTELLQSGLTPNSVIFLSVFYACCHNGLVHHGLKFFDSMARDFKIEPELEYCACIVDLLCRDGRVKDAYNLYKTNFSKPMANALGIVLDACKTNALVELRDVAKEISELDHGDAGRYVQLTHSFASMAQWEGVGKTCVPMRELGLKKLPTWSFIDLHRVITTFFMGQTFYPQQEDIIQQQQTQCIPINWGLERVKCTQSISLPPKK
ncbi:hypothetical protein FXO38_08039 [Capsicum annuum]|nr:hypothetical protein FXO38_08039 [Capsicum annuum]